MKPENEEKINKIKKSAHDFSQFNLFRRELIENFKKNGISLAEELDTSFCQFTFGWVTDFKKFTEEILKELTFKDQEIANLRSQLNNEKSNVQNERNRVNDLQNQLDVANSKIIQAQNMLGIGNLDDLELELKGFDGEVWNLERWKKEIELEQLHSEQLDNFYRHNPPSENTSFANILQEITKNYLALNLEKEQLKQENKQLKENIQVLENLASQTEDIFLPAKIEEKREQLTSLEQEIKNNLEERWQETLEDLLEAQQTVFANNNDYYAQRQLKKFKKRLLDSQQISSEQLNKLCQIQNELSFLELRLIREQKFENRQEIPPHQNQLQ